jgi:hypothetical protein
MSYVATNLKKASIEVDMLIQNASLFGTWAQKTVLPPIGNKCRQFYISLV